MTIYQKFFLYILAGALFSTISCTSIRANLLLLEKTTDQQKAELLFQEGVALYNDELMGKNNLKAIPEIRTRFTDALALDPRNDKAATWLTQLDSYKKNKFASYMKTASTLYAKEKRTAAQDYEMILAAKKANDLNSFDFELLKLRDNTREIRANLIKARVDQILALEPKILAEKNTAKLSAYLKDSDRLIDEVQAIDPSNGDAKRNRKEIDRVTTGLAQKDIDTAKEKLAAKKYADAEAAILKAEKTLAAVTSDAVPEIQKLKYEIYYGWSANLYSAKKYPTATEKVKIALTVNKTAEAVSLQTKIAKAASVRDYDAEIADLLASVDSFISAGQLAEAKDLVDSTLPRLKVAANKTNLASRNDKILAKVKQVYQDGISSYNEEDYETAKARFMAVVRVEPDYEQAQAYLDRTNTKIRALTGKD